MADKLNDDSPMPWGAHKGKAMVDVPAKYLLYLHDEGKCSGAVKEYIEENMDALIKETK